MGSLVSLVLSLLVSLALGLVLAGNLVLDRSYRGVILWLSLPLGLGVSALLNFAWGLAFYPAFAPWLFLALEMILAAIGLALFWRRSANFNVVASFSTAQAPFILEETRKSVWFLRRNIATKQPFRPWWEGCFARLRRLRRARNDMNTHDAARPAPSDEGSEATGDLGPPKQPVPAATIALAAAAGLAMLLFILVFIGRQVENPFGEWDAWAIWNLRARHLFLGGENWRNAFNPNLHGSDYPALIPYMISRIWSLAGQPNQSAPILIAAVFGVSTLGLLYSLVRSRRGLNQALLAVLVLACTPSFLYWSANQYADAPLGFYFLASAACLYLYHAGQRKSPGFLALSGLLAGLAMWTKNEGLFLPAALLACQALVYWRTTPSERKWSEWAWLLAGAAAPLLLLVIFKVGVAPDGYVTNQGSAALLAKFGEAARYKLIIRSFGAALLSFGRWDVPLLPALLVYFLIVGVNRPAVRVEKSPLALLAGAWALLLLAYGLAYLITPLPLEWQIGESIERLWLQAYPLGLLLLFLLARNPLDPFTEPVLPARGAPADIR